MTCTFLELLGIFVCISQPTYIHTQTHTFIHTLFTVPDTFSSGKMSETDRVRQTSRWKKDRKTVHERDGEKIESVYVQLGTVNISI